ncbi:MAG: methionyl-tRNA formyltransferase [Pseudomonadota bacterium]|nr:methionyl-tRNA formyltransferase [Pseudomonadota bacterium]
MRIVIFASSKFSIPLLEKLHKSEHEICAVYSQPPSISGRGMKLKENEVCLKSRELNLKLLFPDNINKDIEINTLEQMKPDIAVVSAYGQILSSKLLRVPKFGFVNLHPSLLPRWRGAAPIERALMAGDKETGVCTIKMIKELDAGPILAKERFLINLNETNSSLSQKLSIIGANQLLDVINNLELISEIPQESEGVTYAFKIHKSETRINWNLPGKIVDRFIRGLSEKPGAWSMMNGSRVKILKSKYVKLGGKIGQNIISSEKKSSLLIACSEDSVEVEIIQKEGKKPVSASEFISGYKGKNICFE